MPSRSRLRSLAVAVVSGALIAPTAQAVELYPERRRAGLDVLSREMSTCAAYFSLLSSIVQNSSGPGAKTESAERIKSTGQAMLMQSINIANHIGMGNDTVMERVRASLEEMVQTVNADPANSLKVMHTKYGQPCDELLQSAPKRFADLLEPQRDDF